MELTPPSMRSSTSPVPYRSHGQAAFEYPSPAQSDDGCVPKYNVPVQGLGVYGCRVQESPYCEESMIPLPTSEPAITWPNSAMHSRRPSPTSPNNGMSAEYDAFQSLPTTMAPSYHSTMYPTHPSIVSAPSTSPALSCVESTRSSFSSATTSEPYSQGDSYHAFNPRVKMEDHLDWPSENGGSIIIDESHSEHGSVLIAPTSSYPGCFESAFYNQEPSIAWQKADPMAGTYHDSRLHRPVEQPKARQVSEQRKVLSNATRTRTPRKMTTREDANFQCKIQGCGKLFSRSYNYKAHLETHSNSREYPFPCPLSDCSKKFVRKTDLQRHHASVHEKTRNYQCDYCSRYFARKDTLRRHMEDGCSKRFDLSVAFDSSYLSNDQISSKNQQQQQQLPLPMQPSYTSGTPAYARAPRSPGAYGGDFIGRSDYMSNEPQGGSWAS